MAHFLRTSEGCWVNLNNVARVYPNERSAEHYTLLIYEREHPGALPMEVRVEKRIWHKYVEQQQ